LVSALLIARVFFTRSCLGFLSFVTPSFFNWERKLSRALLLMTVSTRAMFFLTILTFPSLELVPFVTCATRSCKDKVMVSTA
jgi:hypothetical protein